MNTNELIQLIETVKAMGYGHIDITHEGTHLMLDEKSLAGTTFAAPAASVSVPAVTGVAPVNNPAAAVSAAASAAPTVAATASQASNETADASQSAGSSDASAIDDADCQLILSPIVGTFYNAPSPEAGPFVQVGDKVKKGDVVCIVEAMKLMNEIDSEFDGEIVEILVENEGPVEYNQPLFKVRL